MGAAVEGEYSPLLSPLGRFMGWAEPSVEMVSGYAVIPALWGKRRNHEECHSSNSA